MALTKTTVAMLEASGTPDSTSFLRGDGSWNSPPQSKQIQSITASVASNILTISTSSLTLDFRSTTSATGTATTITGTPASLAVPASQSFGIPYSGVTVRYAILCFNNAGTLALGLSPLQGEVQLDETNFLSPTSTVTNTLTTIYSTITASNLAYRVIGCVDVIYTSGTGYATAPSLVQGQGGQALSAMGSLGYGQNWQNVTGSRSVGTTYYNTTGKPLAWFIGMAGGYYVFVTINGTTFNGYSNVGGTWLIPAGASYVVNSIQAGSIAIWAELR